MQKTSIRLDPETRRMLDDYCLEAKINFSDALRQFIRDGIDKHHKNKTLGFNDSIGSQGLMVNEKRAIRAAIEGFYLLRSLVQDPHILEEALNKTNEVLEKGWYYDNK